MTTRDEGQRNQETSKSRNFHFHNSSSDESDNESVINTTFQSPRVKKKLSKLARWV
ncbi:hypothetical protein K0M31_009841, partial [Melipona bicolor]